jgi:polyferredoxin
VLWAGGLLLLSVFIFKGFCRYLCPLGAALVLLGRLRRFAWLPRRTECGQPCQRCRKRCLYQAINTTGEIDYDECFQCLDCVAIYQSERLCVPLIVKHRHPNRHVSIPVVAR